MSYSACYYCFLFLFYTSMYYALELNACLVCVVILCATVAGNANKKGYLFTLELFL